MRLKQLITLPLASLALAVAANAYIDPGAPSASHHMEETAAAIHSYLHTAGYPSSYGSHGLEIDSDAVHSALHDWNNGTATESQVAAEWNNLQASWKTFKQTINQAKVLNEGDDELDALFDETKNAYKDLRFLLKKIQS